MPIWRDAKKIATDIRTDLQKKWAPQFAFLLARRQCGAPRLFLRRERVLLHIGVVLPYIRAHAA